jgi:hypothetical protein
MKLVRLSAVEAAFMTIEQITFRMMNRKRGEMRCTNSTCSAELYAGDMFCGKCGRPVSMARPMEPSEGNSDLFPLYGVVLGETTVEQLARLGTRNSATKRNSGGPEGFYEINKTNFWYGPDGVAYNMYIARGIYPIPERWGAIGFDWNLSYNQWVGLLQRLGYAVTIKESPRLDEYEGHDSFSAKISAIKQARIPIEITLGFNYSQGTTTDSQGTLYSISVDVLKPQ